MTDTRTAQTADTLSAYLTVRDAAQLLGISRQRAYRMIAKKQLPAVKVGRVYWIWLVREDALRLLGDVQDTQQDP